jgi:transcriptional regulator with XRE-family HTH domain
MMHNDAKWPKMFNRVKFDLFGHTSPMRKQGSKETVGQRLRDARQSSGLTQQEVTQALGLVRSTLVRWEAADRVPKESGLRTLADLYQVSEEWVRTGKGEHPLCTVQRRESARHRLERLKQHGAPGLPLDRPGEWYTTSGVIYAKEIFGGTPQESGGNGECPVPGHLLRECLASISDRTKWLLNRRPILPVLPGIHPEVLRAMQSGLVIPSPEQMLILAEKTLVHPHWLLTGGDQWVLPVVEPIVPERPLGEADASSAPPSEKPSRAKRSRR